MAQIDHMHERGTSRLLAAVGAATPVVLSNAAWTVECRYGHVHTEVVQGETQIAIVRTHRQAHQGAPDEKPKYIEERYGQAALALILAAPQLLDRLQRLTGAISGTTTLIAAHDPMAAHEIRQANNAALDLLGTLLTRDGVA